MTASTGTKLKQQTSGDAPGFRRSDGRSLLAELLHALNQPLTGLQCSMEVVLAVDRTPEQYVRSLREGLELTERMRALMGALREVAEIEDEPVEEEKNIELATLLNELLGEFGPVAEAKQVRLVRNLSGASGKTVRLKARRTRLTSSLFRVFESTMSLAGIGTELRLEARWEAHDLALQIDWRESGIRRQYSRPELGLMVAEAGLERFGAKWERSRAEGLDTLKITLPFL